MYIVKLGEFFVKESDNPYDCSDRGLNLVNDITKATKFKDIIEFRLAVKYCQRGRSNTFPSSLGKLYDLSGFNHIESIEVSTLEKTIHPIEYEVNDISQDIYVSSGDFEKLKRCFYGSSHWCYIDDRWIAFPEEETEEYKNINKISYYSRGLTDIFSTIFHYRKGNLPSCYSFYKSRLSLLNVEEFRKLPFSKIDDCDRFNIFKKEEVYDTKRCRIGIKQFTRFNS